MRPSRRFNLKKKIVNEPSEVITTRRRIVSGGCTPVATVGEVFDDGSMVELVRLRDASWVLARWDGKRETIGAQVEHRGQFYKPVAINASISRELTLPSGSAEYGSMRQLLSEIAKPVSQFSALPDLLISLVSRTVLASWVPVGPVAPRLLITGPDCRQGLQLLTLLSCLCRHPLRVAGLTPAALCSLPSAMEFTFLISDTYLSGRLDALLAAAAGRGPRIPSKGRLLDFFGVQAIFCGPDARNICSWPHAIRIPVVATGQPLPTLNFETQRRIAEDLQPKLLRYRFVEYQTARVLQFDTSQFLPELRDVAHAFAATTPSDGALQEEVKQLLQSEEDEIAAARWTDRNVALSESMLAHCHMLSKTVVYVGEIAESAQQILIGRGVREEIDPRAVGPRLRDFGFNMEPRDHRGIKIRLTDDVRRLAHDCARQLRVPSQNRADCKFCDPIAPTDGDETGERKTGRSRSRFKLHRGGSHAPEAKS